MAVQPQAPRSCLRRSFVLSSSLNPADERSAAKLAASSFSFSASFKTALSSAHSSHATRSFHADLPFSLS